MLGAVAPQEPLAASSRSHYRDTSLQTVSIHLPKNADQLKGFVNNLQQDWSFRMDGVSRLITVREISWDQRLKLICSK